MEARPARTLDTFEEVGVVGKGTVAGVGFFRWRQWPAQPHGLPTSRPTGPGLRQCRSQHPTFVSLVMSW